MYIIMIVLYVNFETISVRWFTRQVFVVITSPNFPHLQCRALFRKFLKFCPLVGSHSTEEFGAVLASMVCMWMPDEIPLVLATYFEAVLDAELFE